MGKTTSKREELQPSRWIVAHKDLAAILEDQELPLSCLNTPETPLFREEEGTQALDNLPTYKMQEGSEGQISLTPAPITLENQPLTRLREVDESGTLVEEQTAESVNWNLLWKLNVLETMFELNML